MCDKQRLRLACAYVQSDRSLCLSLECSITVKLLTEQHLEFLSLKGGCTDSSESKHVKMSHCWKYHATAHYEPQELEMKRLVPIAKHVASLICNPFMYMDFKSGVMYLNPSPHPIHTTHTSPATYVYGYYSLPLTQEEQLSPIEKNKIRHLHQMGLDLLFSDGFRI